MKSLIAFIAGCVFSCGLIISQMTDPGKVLGFLTLNRDWDPSLIFVMGAGVVVMWLANLWRKRHMDAPVYETKFSIPKGWGFDRDLVLGAVLFGIGWALVGLCPAPAIAGLATLKWEVWVFFLAMSAGMIIYRSGVKKDFLQ